MKITKAESQLIRDEVLERIKDVIYTDGPHYVGEMLKDCKLNKYLDEFKNDEYVFHFRVAMMAGDFRQILMRNRRKETNDKS